MVVVLYHCDIEIVNDVSFLIAVHWHIKMFVNALVGWLTAVVLFDYYLMCCVFEQMQKQQAMSMMHRFAQLQSMDKLNIYVFVLHFYIVFSRCCFSEILDTVEFKTDFVPQKYGTFWPAVKFCS